MHLFYYPQQEHGTFTLDEGESTHCIRVLRLGEGDVIFLTNGRGTIRKARIKVPDRKACVTEIIGETYFPPERNWSFQLAVAPTKQVERFEWFLEKATEIGIDRIIPLICSNSERRTIKEERSRKVIISAMKQSLKAWLPELVAPQTFDELMNREFSGDKYIATASAPEEDHLGRMLRKGNDKLVLIGPEGDFSPPEMEKAVNRGFIPVTLGKARLRTETAGIVACHTVNLMNLLK